MKKIFFSIFGITILVASFFIIPSHVNAETNVYFFRGEGCPHCAKEEIYLTELAQQNPNIKIYDFEIYQNKDNVTLLKKAAAEIGFTVSGVPVTIIGTDYTIGFSETTTPQKIEALLAKYLNGGKDPLAEILGISDQSKDALITKTENESTAVDKISTDENMENLVHIPILGNINARLVSLPLLTIILGGLDGFNPCAMWALIFLITMLLGMKDRKKMWILGGSFILTSAIVYFFFMVAWLNLILFLGLIIWLRLAVGILAIGAGGYHLKKFFSKTSNTCEISTGKHQTIFFEKVKDIVHKKGFWLALGGIIALACVVNLIELFCSAGLPVIYTQILTFNGLSTWEYYLYISFYIFIFMLDDLVVFFIAMTTLRLTGITTKYNSAIQLVSGLLMFAIGILMIFRPDLLMFG
jgi:thiol-disulfide isomerase/thioredoxin